jgi:hypothetical protein
MVVERNSQISQSRVISSREPPDAEAVRNGTIVGRLQETLDSEDTLRIFPKWLLQVIEEGLWRRFWSDIAQAMMAHNSFSEFVTAKKPRGLGRTMESLLKECQFYANDGEASAIEALPKVKRLLPAQAKHGANQHTRGDDNVMSSSVQGNSPAYALRRLKRDHPELARKVERGELSANAAAIQAGFRPLMIQHPVTVEGFTAAARKHLNRKQQAELIALLRSNP